MSEENVDAVRRVVDAWNRGDIDAWLEPLHPEIEWFSPIAAAVEGADTVFRGHAGLRRFWDEWRAVFDLTIELSEIRDLDHNVLALGCIRTRGAASGIDLVSQVGYLWEFDRGSVRRVRAYLNRQEALEAAGLRE